MPLRLGQHDIERLNGPVSFHLLQPCNPESQEPTFALFGDIHDSPAGIKPGEIAIYDDHFMESLDRLGKPTAFLIEETDVQPAHAPIRAGMMPRRINPISRQQNNPNGYVKNILGVRSMANNQCYDERIGVEGNEDIPPLHIFKKKFAPFGFKDKMGGPPPYHSPFQNIEFILGDLRGIIGNNPEHPYFYESLIDRILNLFRKELELANTSTLLRVVEKHNGITVREIFEQVERIAITAIKTPERLYDVIFNPKWVIFSSINKELKKYGHVQRLQWMKYIQEFLSENIYVDPELIPVDKTEALTIINAAFDELKLLADGEEHKFHEIHVADNRTYITKVFLGIGAMLTDINMILRVYNPQRKVELVCGYMGRDHITKGLTHFLTQIQKSHYVEGVPIINERDDRCLKFNTVITL